MEKESFFEMVYQVVRQIPEGRVTSYGAIARFLGARRSARMVGWAMNACHGVMPPIPAQRVVNASGLLTGRAHFSPPEQMQLLLESEGIEIENNQVKNFNQVFWDPESLIKN